jgi:hypothetical protein
MVGRFIDCDTDNCVRPCTIAAFKNAEAAQLGNNVERFTAAEALEQRHLVAVLDQQGWIAVAAALAVTRDGHEHMKPSKIGLPPSVRAMVAASVIAAPQRLRH